jgi:hypothetical protein
MVEELRDVTNLSSEKQEIGNIVKEIWAKSKIFLKEKNFRSISPADSKSLELTFWGKNFFESPFIINNMGFDLIILRSRKDSNLQELFTFCIDNGGFVSKEINTSGKRESHNADKNDLQDLLDDINKIEEIKKYNLEKKKFHVLIERWGLGTVVDNFNN